MTRLFDFAGETSRGKLLSSAATRQQPVSIRFASINSPAATQIEIPLFDGKAVQAVQRESEGFIRHSADAFTWSGKIYGAGGRSGDVVFTVHKNAVAGSIYAPSGVYSIVPQADGAHVLVEIDPSRFPPDADDALLVSEPGQNSEPTGVKPPLAPQVDDGSQIDVLVVYSDDLRAFLGGTSQALAFAQQAIAVTNAAYQNSGVIPRLRLVHAMELDYPESGNTATDLIYIRTHEGVANARNVYKADAVAFLIANATNACGTAFLMSASSGGFESNAYSVSVRACAVDNLTFPHELGHNQGANHNPENGLSPSQAIFPYAFGHYVSGGASPFRTILSTAGGVCTNCPRIPYFSNPGVTYHAQPTGITDERENARTINNTAVAFSQFRNSALAVTDLRSRKVHGSTARDVDLRLGDPRAIECRSGGAGGNHQILVTFAGAVTVGGVTVASTDSLATATHTASGAVVTIDLASVTNAQTVWIRLTNVTAGSATGEVFFPFHVLLGDTNGNGSVTATDISQVKSHAGQPVTEANFRTDVTGNDGSITASDISLVKSASGTQLP